VLFVGFGDRREAEHFPRLQAENVADEVVLVQPLHDDRDVVRALVVEPAVKGVDEPLVAALPLRLGLRLFGLQRVIDQNRAGPASGQHPTGGGGEPIALAGGDELLHGLAVGGKTGREDPSIPRAHHDAAAIAGELVGEILGITDAEDLGRRVVPETPGGKGDRGHQGFEVARWQIDDEAADLALLHRGQRGGDDLEMPIHCQLGLRIELVEAARNKGGEVVPQHGLVLGARQVLNHRILVFCRAVAPSAAR